MEGVEDIPGTALAEGMTWDWETFPEYLDALEKLPRTVDVGTQVPHGAVRAYVMGERGARNQPQQIEAPGRPAHRRLVKHVLDQDDRTIDEDAKVDRPHRNQVGGEPDHPQPHEGDQQRQRDDRRHDLESERDQRWRHARVLHRPRRSAGVQPAAESAGADDAAEAIMERSRSSCRSDRGRILACIRPQPERRRPAGWPGGVSPPRCAMKTQIPESRLDQLRQQASLGTLDAKGIRPPGSPFPEQKSYYGLPIVKPPVWTWEIPLYFFVGGAAGASSVIALTAQLTGASKSLVEDARWIAAIGAVASGPLLILDLGRPDRFLNMLRVFKPQSPMSVGAWTLTLFGAATTGAVIADKLDLSRIGDAAAFVAALSGLGMATYTGVLLGATAIPVWAKHAKTLPIHFGASGLASAAALLTLRGHDDAALNALGLAAAAFEMYTGIEIEVDRGVESEPLRHGVTGITTRIGGFFSGPLPLALRLLGIRSKRARRAASASALLGSLITRLAWVEAGKASAADPQAILHPVQEKS
jgi:hypothetical protein